MIATDKKALITVGQGYGNIVLATPTIVAVNSLGYRVDVLVESHLSEAATLLAGWDAVDTIFLNRKSLMRGNPVYDVVVRTAWNRCSSLGLGLETLLEPLSLKAHHEAVVNLTAARSLGFVGTMPAPHVESDLPFWPLPENYIVIAPGHGGSRRNDWSRKAWPHWRAFCEQAHERFGIAVVVLGTSSDEQRWMLNKSMPWLQSFCGRTSIRGAAGIIGESNGVVAVDNGLAHIGGAMNAPVVALFGPTSGIKNRPLGQRVTFVADDIACRPCQMTERWKHSADWRCMRDLSPEHVLKALQLTLEESCPSSSTA